MLYTIGHGDRTLDDLVECLHSFGIVTVADVRSFPPPATIRTSAGKSSNRR